MLKATHRVVGFCLSLGLVTGWAAPDPSLSNDPASTPRQIYKEAIDPNAPVSHSNSPDVTPGSLPPSIPPAATTPATPATPASSGPATPANATLPASSAPVPQAAPSVGNTEPAGNAGNNGNMASLQDQITLINQNSVIFAQTVNAKFEGLSNQVTDLDGRVQALSQAMQLMNQEVEALRSGVFAGAVNAAQSGKSASGSPKGLSRYGVYDYVFWVVVLGLVTVILSFFRRNKAQAPVASAPVAPTATKAQAPVDLEGDYDYLGSQESMPAKLNLARAYVAMGNLADAKQVLDDVMQNGDNKQRMEAEALLKKIAKP
jgi:FimV-like protein